jgi:ferredoxin--NADP+ reductase
MNVITEKEFFSENVVKLVVEAPLIARSRKPGNFVILRVSEKGERVPLTIAGTDLDKGTITLIAQKVGVSTEKLAAMNPGDSLIDLVGPLGKATEIHNVGTILACGGGVGVAPLLPIVEGFKKAGNRVITVLAARTKDLIILEDEIGSGRMK